MWSEQLHPRNAKGPGGGEFKSTSGGGQAQQMRGRTARSAGGGTLSYNGRTGTGYGKKGGDPRVKRLQQALNRLGIKDAHGKPLAVDGKLGPLTTQAIKAWQKRNGMRPTGSITAADIKRMGGGGHKKAHLLKSRTGRTRATALTARRTSLTARAK